MNQKVLPLPGSLSAQMAPPISSTSLLEIVSPSPVPPKRRVVDPSACSNGWKMVCNLSAGMPMPVSETATCSVTASGVDSSTETAAMTSPRSVNLMALPTRLTRTWRRRPESPIKRSGTSDANPAGELEALRVGPKCERLKGFIERVAQPERGVGEAELAGLDLGEIEDVIDHRQE